MFPDLLSRAESSEGDPGGGHISEQVVQQLFDGLKTWKTSNSESVGLLWHDLFK